MTRVGRDRSRGWQRALAAIPARRRRRRQGAAAQRRRLGAGRWSFETAKGTFEIETYPNEAPKTVEHILALVQRNFYNGLRIHRVVPGFVVQFGDPQTRDMTKRDSWGTGGSGKPIGVAEISPEAHAPARRRRAGARWRSDAAATARCTSC